MGGFVALGQVRDDLQALLPLLQQPVVLEIKQTRVLRVVAFVKALLGSPAQHVLVATYLPPGAFDPGTERRSKHVPLRDADELLRLLTSLKEVLEQGTNEAYIGHADADRDCLVCLDRHMQSVLPCGHGFCEQCVQEWSSRATCPLCRRPYTQADLQEAWQIEDWEQIDLRVAALQIERAVFELMEQWPSLDNADLGFSKLSPE